MADLKISQLTGASTPLAGTEVLPIVQSGSTVKVSIANLTAGRAVASAGGTFSDNFVQGTAAKGVNFTANTPAAGMTSQLLNWYEEGTWTPTISADTVGNLSVSYSTQNANYTRVGRIVTVNFDIVTSAFTWTTASGNLRISGLPFTVNSSSPYAVGTLAYQGIELAGFSQVSSLAFLGQTYLIVAAFNPGTNQNYTNISITNLPSGGTVALRGTISYIV